MRNERMHERHNWNPLKDLLKEKISAAQKQPQQDESQQGDHWNRFENITGKSRDEIRSELRRY
jgi:hypothetical protein